MRIESSSIVDVVAIGLRCVVCACVIREVCVRVSVRAYIA